MGLQQRKAGVGGEKFHSPPGLDRGNTSHGCRPLQTLRGCTKEGRWLIYGKELPRNKGTPASRGLGSLTNNTVGTGRSPGLGPHLSTTQWQPYPTPKAFCFFTCKTREDQTVPKSSTALKPSL